MSENTECFSINSQADLYIDTDTETALISQDAGETGIELDLDHMRRLAALLGYAITRIED